MTDKNLKRSVGVMMASLLTSLSLSACVGTGEEGSIEITATESTHLTTAQTQEQETTFTETAFTEEMTETESESTTAFDEVKTEVKEESESTERAPESDMALAELSLEEKICQMFALMPDALAGGGSARSIEDISYSLQMYPVGGLLFMGNNLINAGQTRAFTLGAQEISLEKTGLEIFTFTDEEGGSVRRISGKFDGIPYIKSMGELVAEGGDVYATGLTMGSYLADLGFNADFAPVADVLSNPANTVIGDRSFGSDPVAVARDACELAKGLATAGVIPVYKHFPGHGGTEGDTHEGYAYTLKNAEELGKCELVPFKAAVDDGADMIMVAHISLPNVTGDNTPASLSPEIISGILRGQMGFQGIVITDAFNMGAIADSYSSGEAAVLAIEAGVDMVLAPVDFFEAYEAVLNAVHSGRISEERIDESVGRIVAVKQKIER